jgi:hypothetical protein
MLREGVSPDVVDQIIDNINVSIQNKISSVLESGVYSASQHAEEIRAKGFMSEISVRPNGDRFEITTDSGKHDYSRPPFPMLESLLARGKVSKDGSLYKVIPIGANNNKQTATIVKDISAGIAASKEIASKPKSLTDAVANVAHSFGFGARPMITTSESKPAVEVQFRTASSKQDRNTQWVRSGLEADMTPVLSEINATMAFEIENAVENAISEYQMEIDNAIRNA